MSLISAATTAIVSFFDMVNLVQTVERHDLFSSSGDQSCQMTSIINRIAILGLSTAEAVGRAMGSSPQALEEMKARELFCRMCDLPLQGFALYSTELNRLEYFERAIVAPMTDIVRVKAEMEIHAERALLEQYEKDPEHASRFEEKKDLSGSIEIRERPIDPKECLARIQANKSTILKALAVRIAAEEGMAKKGVQLTSNVIENILCAVRKNTLEEMANWKLITLPESLEKDEFLKECICAIKFVITLDPVTDSTLDPTNLNDPPVIYDKQTLLKWIKEKKMSPTSGKVMDKSHIVELPEVREEIERLKNYYEDLFFAKGKLWDFVKVPDNVLKGSQNSIKNDHRELLNSNPVKDSFYQLISWFTPNMGQADGMDFLALKEIPKPFHKDHAFRYKCRVTGEPVRDPVLDPDLDEKGLIIYDREAIIKAINDTGISPVTRKPLTIAKLGELPRLKKEIEDQLLFYQKNIWDFIEIPDEFLYKQEKVETSKTSLLNQKVS